MTDVAVTEGLGESLSPSQVNTYPNEKFDFLGYTFQPRRSKRIARGSSHQFQSGGLEPASEGNVRHLS
jgi:hypothetical protein